MFDLRHHPDALNRHIPLYFDLLLPQLHPSSLRGLPLRPLHRRAPHHDPLRPLQLCVLLLVPRPSPTAHSQSLPVPALDHYRLMCPLDQLFKLIIRYIHHRQFLFEPRTFLSLLLSLPVGLKGCDEVESRVEVCLRLHFLVIVGVSKNRYLPLGTKRNPESHRMPTYIF